MAPKTYLKLGEYKMWITIAGTHVGHYGVEVDYEKNLATCWIPSQLGKKFEINARKSHQEFDCVVDVTMDNSPVDGMLLYRSNVGTGLMNEIRSGEGTARPFLFSSPNTTDDDSVLKDPESRQPIGEIKLVVRQIYEISDRNSSMYSALDNRKVHERLAKALPHQVLYGNDEKSSVPLFSAERGRTLSTFIIRYRSHEFLQAKGIIPLDDMPRPEILSGKRKKGAGRTLRSSARTSNAQEVKRECSTDNRPSSSLLKPDVRRNIKEESLAEDTHLGGLTGKILKVVQGKQASDAHHEQSKQIWRRTEVKLEDNHNASSCTVDREPISEVKQEMDAGNDSIFSLGKRKAPEVKLENDPRSVSIPPRPKAPMVKHETGDRDDSMFAAEEGGGLEADSQHLAGTKRQRREGKRGGIRLPKNGGPRTSSIRIPS